MNNSKKASSGPAFKRRDTLGEAVRCALAQQRPALRIGAGLVALGLATQPVLAATFPAEIELSSLQTANGGDGSTGFVLNGIDGGAFGDRSGRSVSAAGDVNGDGIDDVLIGAFSADPGGRQIAGESYVVFGRDPAAGFPAEFELSNLLPANGGNGSAGFVLNGIDAYDVSGISVSAAGDVNGDGIDDLLVGAHAADPGGRGNAGQSYVVFGRGTGFAAEFELSSLLAANGGDGSSGFMLNGIDNIDYSGVSVSAAGDVNGDGIDDLLVGAHEADPGGRYEAGESYVVFGRDQTTFPAEFELSSLLQANGGNGSAGFVLNGIDGGPYNGSDYGTGDHSGFSLSAAGDVNGDDVDDLVVGAYRADPGGRLGAGESYVVFGRDQTGFPAEFELSSLQPANGSDGSAGFVLNGINRGNYAGISVSEAGDVNGDGIDDLLVSAGRYAAESYVVFGRDQTAFPAEFELSSLQGTNGGDGSAGFILNGIDFGANSLIEATAAGDVNGDGTDDLLIGAPYATPGGRGYAGESYVVFGRDQTAFPAEFELSSLAAGDGSAGFVLNGIDPGDFSSTSVSAAGDINSDGTDDLLIGAPSAGPSGRDGAGETYVVFGRPIDGVVTMCDSLEATIVGTAGNDTITGTAGRDVIHGLGGSDMIRGFGGDDVICGGEGEDTVNGGAGQDRMLGEAGDDDLFGGPGNDDMDGGDDNDRLFGGGDNDDMDGGNDDDQLFGKGGTDIMRGGVGNDRLFGDEADDQLFGDEGVDQVYGGEGNDDLFGGLGNDRLFGQAGNDDMDGGAAFDRCTGGGGAGDTATNCEQIASVP